MLQVVRELNLAERWSLGGNEDAAASKLSSLVEPSYESQKGLTVIEVSRYSPEEASELANAVVNAYLKNRNESTRARAESAIAQLQKELGDQKRNVDAKRAEMLRIMEHYDIKFSDDNSEIIETSKPPPHA